MAMRKIKKGDDVYIRTGKDSGRRGNVISVINEGMKVVVEGINVVKRHTRANPSKERAGGIIEKEAPIDISKVAIWNSATNKPDRVGFKFLGDGQKVRIFKSTGEVIDL